MYKFNFENYLYKYDRDYTSATTGNDDYLDNYKPTGFLSKMSPDDALNFISIFKDLHLSVDDIKKSKKFILGWYEVPGTSICNGIIEFSYYIQIKKNGYDVFYEGSTPLSVDFDGMEFYDFYGAYTNNWYLKLHNSLKSTFPKIKHFYGFCHGCKTPTTLKEFLGGVYTRFNCKIQEESKAQQLKIYKEEKSRLQKSKRLEKLENKTKTPTNKNYTITSKFTNFSLLRPIIHKVYSGRCQYCDKPELLPLENTVVEHIISRSITIESVIDNLRQEGFSEDSIVSFKKLLPPFHNSLLNLTLACPRHNRLKSNSILNPVSMELLLRRAERKAEEILRIYQNKNTEEFIESSEGTSNSLDF